MPLVFSGEILTRQGPFKDKPEAYKGREGQAKYTLEGHRPVPPQEWPKELRLAMQLCWNDDPNKRPTFADILSIWDGLAIKFLCPKDPVAHNLINHLWKDQTRKPTYSEFREAFIKHCSVSKKLPLKNEILLEELCRENIINPTVTFEQFCHVIGWYGPLNSQTDCSEFFTRFRDIKSQWFFRSVESDQDSDRLLKIYWDENINVAEDLSPSNRMSFLKPLDDQNDYQQRPFILKYYLNEIGKFDLRYQDNEGQIQNILILNKEGVPHFPGNLNLIPQWSNLNTLLKYLNALHL